MILNNDDKVLVQPIFTKTLQVFITLIEVTWHNEIIVPYSLSEILDESLKAH